MLFTTVQRRAGGALGLASALCVLAMSAAPAEANPQGVALPGAVFTATNDAQGNAVMAYRRHATGQLEFQGLYPTGGTGSGSGLGNQGALTLDESGTRLLVVNAGSDSVSVFAVGPRGPQLLDVAGAGGSQPISVTLHGDLVYVLDAGGDGNIAGLELAPDGSLSPLAGSVRPLGSVAPGPAQIAFSPDGRFLVVSEKGTNSLVTYSVGADGLPGNPVVTASAGTTPFGFSFGARSTLLVSEASGGAPGLSTVSSYEMLADGSLAPITSALATTQSAACWLIATTNRRFAYVTNTGSDTVTGLALERDGSLQLLQASGVTAPAGDAPIDAAVSRNGRYLYVLNAGDDSISSYRILSDGSLQPVAGPVALPDGANGLAAL